MSEFDEHTPHHFTLRLSLPVPQRVFEKLDQGHRQKRRCPVMQTPVVPLFLRRLREANDEATAEMKRTVNSDLWENHLRHVIEYHTVLSGDALTYYIKPDADGSGPSLHARADAPAPIFTVKFVRKNFVFEFADLDTAFVMYTFMRKFKFYRDSEVSVEPHSQLVPLIACLNPLAEPTLDYDSDGCEVPRHKIGLFTITQGSQIDFYHWHFRIGMIGALRDRRSRLEYLREKIDIELAKIKEDERENTQIMKQLEEQKAQQ